jgi:ABC-type sugar transport system ATPase subunit
MNFIKGQVLRVEGTSATIGFAGTEAAVNVRSAGVAAGDHVTVGIRPEHMEEGGADTASLRGTIDAVEQLGESSYVYMKLASGDDVIVRAPGETDAVPGGSYTAHVPTRALHVFDASGVSVLAERI